MNKKAVLLPIVVLLAALMIGSAMGTPVKAYDDNCGPPSCDDQAVSPPCQPPVHYEISGPFSMSCPGRVWQAGNTIHMRGLELVGCFVMCDSAGHELPGVAILNVNSDVNVKKCQATARVHIILETDYGWWYFAAGEGFSLSLPCPQTCKHLFALTVLCKVKLFSCSPIPQLYPILKILDAASSLIRVEVSKNMFLESF